MKADREPEIGFGRETGARPVFLPLEDRLPFLEGVGWRGVARRGAERLMGLPEVRRRIEAIGARVARGEETFRALLDELEVALDAEGVVEAIPRDGPVVVIANHPFGGVEPLALSTLVLQARPDVKVLGNVEAGALPGIERWLLPLEILDEKAAVRKNVAVLREALAHLREGGLLAVFPAGAVAHWQTETARVEDPPWFPHTARLVRRAGAAVVPVRFFGQNGPLFQLLGMVHPLLRSALIPRAFLAMRGATLRCRAGEVLRASKLPDDPTELNTALRAAVYRISPGD